jgi:uncharacterized protein YcbK (DUF882 family)
MIHFTHSEFDSPDQKGSGKNMKRSFLNMLDDAREIAGVPFIVNSGWRTTEHNEDAGGKSGSSHLKGYAVDLKATDSRTRFIILHALIAVGFTRIGIGKTFIHVDNDPNKDKQVTWLY